MLCFHQFESWEEPVLLCWCRHCSQFTAQRLVLCFQSGISWTCASLFRSQERKLNYELIWGSF